MTTKFSQFPAGGTIGVGAKIAGLDASVSPDNRIFDFPGLGILDTNGSVLLGWSQPLSGTAVNYLEFQNALSGNPAVISAVGGDTDVGLYLTSQNDGNISLVPGGQGVTIIAGTTALSLPSGSTGQRPVGNAGYTRYNSDTGTLEYYDGLGNTWNTLSAGGTVASVSGTTGRITSTGGVNPVIDIDFGYVGQTSIQNLGTITTGAWNANLIDVVYGGTGLSAVTAYSVVCGGTTDTGPLQVVSGLGSAGQVLTSNGPGTLPTWQSSGGGGGSVISVSGTAGRITSTGGTTPVIDIDPTYVGQNTITTLGTVNTGTWNGTPVTVPFGGTGDSSFTAYSLICAGTTNTGNFQNVVGLGVLGQVLTSQGAGSLPIWTSITGGTVSSVSGTAGQITVVNGSTTPVVSIAITYAGQTSITTLGTITTGVWNGSAVDVAHGGTGDISFAPYQIICGGTTSTAALQTVAGVGTTGQVLTSQGAGALPIWSALPGGTVTSVSGTANRITSTGGTTPVIDIAATYVGQSSITTLGTIISGVWNGTLIGSAYGGTGVNNGSSTITLGGNLVTSGAFSTTLTVTGATNVTLPTSGTLAILGNNDFNFGVQYRQQIKDYSETVNVLGNVSGAVTIDLTLGNVITATATGSITSITVTNVPAAGTEASFSLRATNFGSFTISWPAGTSWGSGSTPTLAMAGLSIVVFTTIDAGTTWQAFYPGQAVGTVTAITAGTGLSGGTINNSGTIALATNNKASGRLTLSSGVPVTTSDVLTATTIYYTPYNGNYIDLYTAGAWKTYSFSQVSLAVPNVANQMYDIFMYDNSGVLTLSTVAWTNDTTRATALTTQNGTYVLNGSPQYRYLGSFRTTAVAGQTEDSVLNRLVWNSTNQVSRPMYVMTNTSWTYAVNTIRQANGSSANQVNFVIGLVSSIVESNVSSSASTGTNNRIGVVYIGLNSTTAAATNSIFNAQALSAAGSVYPVYATYKGYPALGYNYLAWLESSPSAVAVTYGTVAGLNQGGIIGTVMA